MNNKFAFNPEPMSQKITSHLAESFLRKDGIMQVNVYPEVEMNLNDAVESVQAQAVLANGKKRPLIVHIGKIKSMSRDARVYLGGSEAAKNVTATALITSSYIGTVIANFFIGLNKTLYPTKLFSSEEEALKWLVNYL